MRAVHALAALLALALVAGGCGDPELRRQRLVEYSFLDSTAVYLQRLRAMDQEIGQAVLADTVNSVDIVPLISARFRPTVADLRTRVGAVATTERLVPVRDLFVQYLSLRLEAYDAAIAGLAEDRPELYDVFSRQQAEADRLGRALGQQIREVRTQVPGYR
ncbi:MAG: hypothetical protein ABIL09_20600 [Gemmatimonadota bacterium]